MGNLAVDIVIIGAGPYGLSLSAHLPNQKAVRIFGEPMRFWTHHMPQGMRLKSEGFASSLSDPKAEFSLKAFCAERQLPYADIGLPVPVETFIAYGQEFQRRYVPHLEQDQITSVAAHEANYQLTTSAGETFFAKKVVIASGIANFAYVPPALRDISETFVTHSSQHSDFRVFKGRRVAVLGAGASALDTAVALLQNGAIVELIARGPTIRFHDKPVEPRPLVERIKAPRSGLGIGWRSLMCTDIPLVFHALPESFRHRVVARHLGPAPCWFVKEAVDGKMSMHLRAVLTTALVHQNGLRLEIKQDGKSRVIEADHLIAGTGYQTAISRLDFIDSRLKQQVRCAADTPVLNRHFEASAPGFFFIGAAAANSFGPLLRFAYGAHYAARRVSARLQAA